MPSSLSDQVCRILQDFKMLRVLVSQSTRVSIADAFYLFNVVYSTQLAPSCGDRECIKEMKQKMRQYLSDETIFLRPLDAPEVVLVAILLDPRTKEFSFLDNQKQQKECIKRASACVNSWIERSQVLCLGALSCQSHPSPHSYRHGNRYLLSDWPGGCS
jgi:hypothetical protein